MKHRLFIAIPIEENIKSLLIENTKLPKFYRITKRENLHITILFLGDTDENQIPQINSILQKATQKEKAFNLSIDSFGQFPEKGLPRIIFVTGSEGCQKLINFANLIRDDLKTIGFYDDKDFKYHITVGRLDEKEKISGYVSISNLKINANINVNKVILYKSDLTQQGPIYTKLSTFDLNIN